MEVDILSPGGTSLDLGDSGLTAANTESGQIVYWQSRWHFDHQRKIGLFLGKEQASTGGVARFCRYDELTNAWDVGIPLWGQGSETGHIYDANAYDVARGEHYQQRHRSATIRRWAPGYALTQWDDLSIDFSPVSAVIGSDGTICSSGEAGQAFHPNLFGPGDGGLVITAMRGIFAWRRSTGACVPLTTYSYGSATPDTPCVEYVAGLNAVLVSLANDNRTWRVDAGPSITEVAGAPIPIGCRASGNCARTVDDPLGRGFAWCLEVNGSARVWQWDGDSFNLQAYTHPIAGAQSGNQAACVIAAVRPYGVIWALERINNTLRSRLWKPPA